MNTYDLKPGNFARIRGAVYCLKHKSVDGDFCFQDLQSGNQLQVSPDELLRLYTEKKAQIGIPDPSKETGWERKARGIDFASLPLNQREAAEQRQKILDEILSKGSPRPIKTYWPKIIEDVVAREGLKAISWQQANRSMKKYLSSGKDVRSLIPATPRRGAGRLKQLENERDFFEALLENHKRGERPTIKKTYDNIRAAYRKARREIVGAKNWKPPSYATVRRRLQEIDPYEAMRAREGKRAADSKYKYYGRREAPLHVLEMVEIDHTVIDLKVVDARRGYILGRPTVTVAIDVYSHMVVGIYIGLEPAGTSSVMQCIRNMVLPKLYIESEYPDISALGLTWPALGIPINIVVDNGLEFHSESVKGVCDVLGTSVIYTPVYTPQAKGLVERFMETISVSCLDGLPGRTFHNPQERGDYDSDSTACITLQEFRKYFHLWLIAQYHHKTILKFGETPQQRWMRDVERNPVRLPYDPTDIDKLLGTRKSATLSKEGITYLGLRYCSPELNAIRRDPEFDRLESKKVAFLVNETDLGTISVINPITLEPLIVPCATQDVSKDITLYQHKMVRKMISEQGEDPDKVEALEKGHDMLIDMMDEFLARNKTTNRKKKARGLGGELTKQPQTTTSGAPKSKPSTALRDDLAADFEKQDEGYRAPISSFKPFYMPDASKAARPASATANPATGFEPVFFGANQHQPKDGAQ